jgi:hypothetical protein
LVRCFFTTGFLEVKLKISLLLFTECLGEVADIVNHPLKHEFFNVGTTPGDVLENVSGEDIITLAIKP